MLSFTGIVMVNLIGELKDHRGILKMKTDHIRSQLIQKETKFFNFNFYYNKNINIEFKAIKQKRKIAKKHKKEKVF